MFVNSKRYITSLLVIFYKCFMSENLVTLTSNSIYQVSVYQHLLVEPEVTTGGVL